VLNNWGLLRGALWSVAVADWLWWANRRETLCLGFWFVHDCRFSVTSCTHLEMCRRAAVERRCCPVLSSTDSHVDRLHELTPGTTGQCRHYRWHSPVSTSTSQHPPARRWTQVAQLGDWCAMPTPEKFIVQLLYVRRALHRTCLFMSRGGVIWKGVGHFRRTFHRERGVAHQPLLVSEN